MLSELQTRDPAQQQTAVLGYLGNQVAAELGVPAKEIHSDPSLQELGVDSFLVMTLFNNCRRDLNIILYPRELYEYP